MQRITLRFLAHQGDAHGAVCGDGVLGGACRLKQDPTPGHHESSPLEGQLLLERGILAMCLPLEREELGRRYQKNSLVLLTEFCS